MTTALVWTVDGLRVPATPKRPQRPPQRNTAVSRAILEAQAAATDLTIPNLDRFGARLTPAQAATVARYLTRRRPYTTTQGDPT